MKVDIRTVPHNKILKRDKL